MKIRQGFVSNSSSSSFILCVKKDAHDKVMLKLPQKVKQKIEAGFESINVFGIDCVYFGRSSDAGGFVYYTGEIEADSDYYDSNYDEAEDYSIYDAFDEYKERIKSEDSFILRMSCG